MIGTFDWDPYGESIVAVLDKMAVANVLTRREMFGLFGLRAYGSAVAENPDAGGHERYETVARMAEWPDAMLSASVHQAYSASGAVSRIARPYRALASRAPFVRSCPACTEAGIHLALFQVEELERCPIHGNRLLERCPRCDLTSRLYTFSIDDTETLGCRRCGWGDGVSYPSSADDALRAAKRAVVSEVVDWARRIRALAAEECPRVVPLHEPDSVRPLSLYHRLLPGPDWFDTCLRAASRTRVTEVPVASGDFQLRRACDSVRTSGIGTLDRHAREITKRCTERLRARLISEFELSGRQDGAFLCSTGYRRRIFDDSASEAALALSWWTRFLSPIPLERTSAENQDERWSDPALVPLWALWRRVTTGLVVRRATGRPASYRGRFPGRSALARELVSLWADRFLEALYLALIGRASLFSSGQVHPSGVLDSAEATGAMPLIALRRTDSRLELLEVTNVAPTREFVTLFRSGYTGFEGVRSWDAIERHPVHDLVALPPRERARSLERLRELTGGRFHR